MSDDTPTGIRPVDHAASGDAGRDEVVNNLGAALARLRGAVDRLGAEVEANAAAEWVRAKPELRETITDLQGMVDTLAQRARAALGDLGSRLDDDRDQRPGG